MKKTTENPKKEEPKKPVLISMKKEETKEAFKKRVIENLRKNGLLNEVDPRVRPLEGEDES
jgi:hypothetical protein